MVDEDEITLTRSEVACEMVQSGVASFANVADERILRSCVLIRGYRLPGKRVIALEVSGVVHRNDWTSASMWREERKRKIQGWRVEIPQLISESGVPASCTF